MLYKLFVFIFLVALTCLVTFAQNPTSPESDENKAKNLLRLAYGANQSYMGVEVKEVTRENYSKMGLSEVRGVGLVRVLRGSPAETAGLKVGDVIIGFNGHILTSRRQFTRLISEVAPDHKANLTVLRGGNEMAVPITIGKRPAPQLFEGNSEPPKMDLPKGENPKVQKVTIPDGKGKRQEIWQFSSRRSIGVGVAPLTKQLAGYFGIKDGKGLLVNRVGKGGPADKAGIRAGDVIVKVDNRKVRANSDLIRGIYEKKEGEIKLTIIRKKKRRVVFVLIEKQR